MQFTANYSNLLLNFLYAKQEKENGSKNAHFFHIFRISYYYWNQEQDKGSHDNKISAFFKVKCLHLGGKKVLSFKGAIVGFLNCMQ